MFLVSRYEVGPWADDGSTSSEFGTFATKELALAFIEEDKATLGTKDNPSDHTDVYYFISENLLEKGVSGRIEFFAIGERSRINHRDEWQDYEPPFEYDPIWDIVAAEMDDDLEAASLGISSSQYKKLEGED